MQNSEFCIRITNLDETQTSPGIWSLQNSVISIRIASLYGSQPSSVDFVLNTAHYGQELLVFLGPRPHLWY